MSHAQRTWPIIRKLEARSAPPNEDGCWLWTGYVAPHGYGMLHFRGKKTTAHRVAYELLVGPIPEGLVVDHLCRNRACINPAHLEPVRQGENVRRGLAGVLHTHCPQGHELTPGNIYIRPDLGTRSCLVCRQIRNRTYVRQPKAAAPRGCPQNP